MSTEHRFFSGTGDLFVVPKGRVNGIVHFEKHVDPQRGIGEGERILEIVFAFAARTGQVCRYRSFLHADELLPDSSTHFVEARRHFKCDLAFTNCIFKSGRTWPFRTIEWDADRPAERVRATIQMCPEHDRIAIRLACRDDGSAPVEKADAAVEYNRDYEMVLWRKAPLLGATELVVEGSDFVAVTVIGNLGDAGMPKELTATAVLLNPRDNGA